MNLPHRLDRTIVIEAAPQVVFSFFTDNERWAAWWGPGSTIEPKPGGRVYVRHPGGVESLGEVIEIAAPNRIVFSYGFATGKPIAPGSSRVTIALEPVGLSTRLRLSHEFAEDAAAVRDEHVQGWRFQLSLFANVVTNLIHANATEAIDGWFDAWAETDAAKRTEQLTRLAVPDVRFRDRYSLLDGIGDLVPHIGAAQHFMPGISARRKGDVRHCQGTVLVDWAVAGADGQERMKGTNVFTLQADGRIESVVGFWI
jgi:uncharacterized protein YndB with AHSA1/START domain